FDGLESEAYYVVGMTGSYNLADGAGIMVDELIGQSSVFRTNEITKVNASFSLESVDTTKVAINVKLSDAAVNVNDANLKSYEKKTNTLVKTVPLHGD
ncbi:hypothetical protein K3X49_14720, partial [Listeria monocytogenes]|nr:hypothetical protein [Listeria monocytogenes]